MEFSRAFSFSFFPPFLAVKNPAWNARPVSSRLPDPYLTVGGAQRRGFKLHHYPLSPKARSRKTDAAVSKGRKIRVKRVSVDENILGSWPRGQTRPPAATY